MAAKRTGRSGFEYFIYILYFITFAAIVYSFYTGFNYYTTSLVSRPRHPDYWQLKPGAFRSHGFGILGSLMMIVLLGYSIRKRTPVFGQKGSMKNWLNFHIFLGTTGPFFIILHSTFKLNGLVSVSFWSMIAVALSGIIGRYLYLQIPRTIAGNELSLQDVQVLNSQIMENIKGKFELEPREIEQMETELYPPLNDNAGLIRIIGALFVSDMSSYFKSIRIRKFLGYKFKMPKNQTKELINLLRQKAKLDRRLQFWNKIHQMFHYWHVFHKPFAVIMYLIMLIHIGVSVWLGYTWIF
jgi:uncharacterized membrane protein